MDSMRFGKAIGAGAREAAKALARAADAATAPNPAARKAGGVAGQKVQLRVTHARAASLGIRRGGKRFGEAAWGPFLRLSGVLWLEVTGVFFALFALTMGVEVWKRRADLLTKGAPSERVWFAVVVGLVFAYFTVSSFAKASRRGRG